MINMKNNKKTLRNLGTYFLSFIASFVGIFLNFYLARTLEAQAYGKIQYLVALATTFSQFLIFGLNHFLIREANNNRHNGEIFNKCVSCYLILSLFYIPVFFHYSINYASPIQNNLFLTILVVASSFLIGINSIISSYYQGKGKYHLTVLFENLIPKLFLLVLSIVFVLLGRIQTLQNYYLVFYIIIYLVVAIPLVMRNLKNININFEKKDIISIAFFFGVTITYSLGNNLTKVLQGGLYKNDVALAIISVSLNIVSLVRVFTGVLDSIVKPIFAKRFREGDTDGLLSLYRFDTRMNSYVSIPLYIFFIIHPVKFLSLFGNSYLIYSNILTIIALANAVSDLTGPNGTMLAMTGKEKWELFNGFLYFGFYLFFVFVLSFDKVYGLSFSLFVAQIAVNLAKFIEVWIFYKKPPLDLKSIISLLILLASNLIVIFTLKFLTISLLLWFVIGVSVGLALVILNCFVFSLYRKSDFKQLLSLKL